MHHHIQQGPKAMRTLVSHILCMQNFRIGRLSAHSMRKNNALLGNAASIFSKDYQNFCNIYCTYRTSILGM